MGSNPSPRGVDPSGSAPAAPGNAPVEPNTYRARDPAVGSWPYRARVLYSPTSATIARGIPHLAGDQPYRARNPISYGAAQHLHQLSFRRIYPTKQSLLGGGCFPCRDPPMEPVPIEQEPPPHKAASRRAAGQDRAQGAFRLAPAGHLPAGSRPLNLPASHS